MTKERESRLKAIEMMPAVKKLKEPKKYKKITTKQRILAAYLMEAVDNGETPTRSELMKRAGYSQTGVIRDGGVSNTWTAQGFRALCEANGLGADRIRKVIDDASQANTVVTFQGDAVETSAPDHAIRLRSAELLGKISGLQVDRTATVTVNLDANDALSALGL